MNKFIAIVILFLSFTFIPHAISEPTLPINLTESANFETPLTEEPISNNKEPIFASQPIPNDIYQNMIGNSIPYQFKDKIDINTLRYLQVSHFGFDDEIHLGEMIVNERLANDVLDIFKELYDIHYPIEKIKLIDEYNANDELSMSDNNTSSFCYRAIAGTKYLSNHSKRYCNRYKPTI